MCAKSDALLSDRQAELPSDHLVLPSLKSFIGVSPVPWPGEQHTSTDPSAMLQCLFIHNLVDTSVFLQLPLPSTKWFRSRVKTKVPACPTGGAVAYLHAFTQEAPTTRVQFVLSSHHLCRRCRQSLTSNADNSGVPIATGGSGRPPKRHRLTRAQLSQRKGVMPNALLYTDIFGMQYTT